MGPRKLFPRYVLGCATNETRMLRYDCVMKSHNTQFDFLRSNIFCFRLIPTQVLLFKMPKRLYNDQYIEFGFIELKNSGESLPQCVLCMKSLSNAAMKPSLLQRYLQT